MTDVDAARDDRPVFVFQHGLGGDAAQTQALVPPDSRFRVATLECAGHGARSHGASVPSIAGFADDVAAFVAREIAADPALPWVLGGVSMGAAIALRLACQPDVGIGRKPAALVLVRPAWAFASAPANLAVFLDVADAMRRHGTSRGATVFAETAAYAALCAGSPDNARSLSLQFERPQAVADPAATAALLHAIACDGPGVAPERAQAMVLPALVIGCEDDLVHPIEIARELAGTLPNAQFVEVVSKSRQTERHAEQVTATIDRFLARFAPDV